VRPSGAPQRACQPSIVPASEANRVAASFCRGVVLHGERVSNPLTSRSALLLGEPNAGSPSERLSALSAIRREINSP